MSASAQEYDPTTLEASEDLVRYNRWVVASFADAISGRTLEIGAGIGTMSSQVRRYCTELVVVEPAANLAPVLQRRFRADPSVVVSSGLLADVVEAEPELFGPGFDTIVSFNVLEHIEDDVAMLKLAADLLRSGGRLCLFVPSLPSLYGTLDAQVGHVRRYTRATLETALGAAGLRPERVRYFDFLGMIPWFIVGRVLRRTTTGAGAAWYDRLVIPVGRTLDRLIGPPVGKNLTAVAEVAA